MKLNMEVSFIAFILFQMKILSQKGIPKKFLPFQSGVGNVANAVLACIGNEKNISEDRFDRDI